MSPSAGPGPAAGEAPPVLLPYQRRWVEDSSEWKIAEKSRRTGLTWAEAADAALTAARSAEAGGQHHSYIGSGKEMAREFIDAVAMWSRAFGDAASAVGEEVLLDNDREITVFRVSYASGHRVRPSARVRAACADARATSRWTRRGSSRTCARR